MATLATFPDELLRVILSRSDGVVFLWLCGNRALNVRLSRGGCTSFVASVCELIKWPRMLSQLKALQQVVIIAKVVREPIEWMHGVVSNLPSQLEVLHLDFPGSLGLITIEPPISASSPPDDSRNDGKLMQVSTMFPNLQSLHVLRCRDRLPKRFSIFELHSLPRSLTSLFLDGFLHHSLDCRLYPNLTYYEGFSVTPRSDIIQTMRALRTVTVQQLESSADLPDLPPCTTHLILQLGSRLQLAPLKWPSCLTVLNCSQPLNPTAIRSLPHTVETLTFSKLTGINVISTGNEEFAAKQIWPRGLRSLTFTGGEPIHWSLVCTFPRWLTTLNGVDLLFKRGIYGLEFSSSLRHLSFACALETPKRGSLVLPTNLKSLKICWYKCINIVRKLPKGLTWLDVYAPIPSSHISLLPPGLLKLKIGGIYEYSHGEPGDECYEHLPRGLQLLKIKNLWTIPTSFKTLPRSLKLLKLPCCTAKLADFTWLPTSIASLHLKGISDCYANIVPQVPQRWLSFLMESDLVPLLFLEPLCDHWPEEIPITPKQRMRMQKYFSLVKESRTNASNPVDSTIVKNSNFLPLE